MSVENPAVQASRRISEEIDPADPRPHIPALDGVRGLAVLMVVALHAMLIVPRAGGVDVLGWQVLRAGWVGVDLFFVLSGFLITGILYDAKPQPAGGFFLNFYARRILRIAPLYYGYLAFYFYILPRLPVPDAERFVVAPEVRPMFWFYLYNFWGAIHGGMHGNLGVFWSLCVEEHFYLVWPFVVWFLGRRPLMRVCVMLAALSLVTRAVVLVVFPNEHAAYLMTPCRFDGLAMGSFVALALRDPKDWKRLMRWAPRIALAAGAFIVGMAMGQRHLRDDVDFRGRNDPGVDSSLLLCIGLSVMALLFGSLVAMAVNAATQQNRPLQRFLRNPVLRSLGMYSYAIYIFHPLVVTFARQGLNALGVQYPQTPAGALAARLAAIPMILGITYVLAFLSYHAFEKHFLALKRFFPHSSKPVPVPPRPAAECRDNSAEQAERYMLAARTPQRVASEADARDQQLMREAMLGSQP
jgi:peptidoglycan/LPS O-acetylase OafA/YrhL